MFKHENFEEKVTVNQVIKKLRVQKPKNDNFDKFVNITTKLMTEFEYTNVY
jgi:hypothetical protein